MPASTAAWALPRGHLPQLYPSSKHLYITLQTQMHSENRLSKNVVSDAWDQEAPA